jgi:hypothetical protein
VGPVNPIHGDLSIGVSTVTHTPEGIGQYVVPGIHLHMMYGDTEGMTEDEAVLKTSLNVTTSRLSGTHQAPLRLYQNSYRNPYDEQTRSNAIPGVRRRTTHQTHRRSYAAREQEAELHPDRIQVLIVKSTLSYKRTRRPPSSNIHNYTQALNCNTLQAIL